MFHKLFANVIFCLVILNITTVKINQKNSNTLVSPSQTRVDNSPGKYVTICLSNGKCSKTKFKATYISSNKQLTEKDFEPNQSEVPQSHQGNYIPYVNNTNEWFGPNHEQGYYDLDNESMKLDIARLDEELMQKPNETDYNAVNYQQVVGKEDHKE